MGTAAITIRDLSGCVDQPREVWKGLLAFYQASSTSYDRAAVYETRLHMLRPNQFPNRLEFILEFMKTMTKQDQCAPRPYTSATKIMKLDLAFASDPELRAELGRFRRMFPTKGQNFLEVFKHIHNASVQLDGGKVLEQQLKLGSASSVKSHLINQADIDVHQTDISDFYETDSDQDDPDPFPSRDVDGGDILKFSPISNFSSFTHTATMKDHETGDTGLHNDDIRGNVGMNVIDDLEVVLRRNNRYLGTKKFVLRRNNRYLGTKHLFVIFIIVKLSRINRLILIANCSRSPISQRQS